MGISQLDGLTSRRWEEMTKKAGRDQDEGPYEVCAKEVGKIWNGDIAQKLLLFQVSWHDVQIKGLLGISHFSGNSLLTHKHVVPSCERHAATGWRKSLIYERHFALKNSSLKTTFHSLQFWNMRTFYKRFTPVTKFASKSISIYFPKPSNSQLLH